MRKNLQRLTKHRGTTANIGVLSLSGVARGGGLGVQPPIRIEAVFFHSRKVTVIKYYNLSLTTRRTINLHDLRKTNHLGGGGCYC